MKTTPRVRPFRSSLRIASAAGLVATGIMMTACPGPRIVPDVAPEVEAFATQGKHPVGYGKRTLTFDNPITGLRRSIDVNVWYPALSPSDEPAVYGLAIIALETPGATAYPTPAEGGPYPLIVYSHGSGGDGMLGYPYGELLASHGYVVVAPSHAGNTTVDSLRRSTISFTELLVQRPTDIVATMDYFENKKGSDALAALTDTSRVLLFGHSFGGYTTLATAGGSFSRAAIEDAACDPDPDCTALDTAGVADAFDTGFADPRLVALVSQAPAFYDAFADDALSALSIPTLLMSGRRDLTLPDEEQAQRFWAALDHPNDIWMDIPDAGHQSFISTCTDLPDWQKEQLVYMADEDGCGDDFTPASDLVPLMAGYIQRFADLYVKGLNDTDTDWQNTPPTPVVTLKRHGAPME